MGSDEEGPKLYANKPKKSAQLKQHRNPTMASASASTPPSSSSSSSSSGSTATSTTSSSSSSSSSSGLPPRKESLARRFKFVWPILLTLNVGIGAYVYLTASKKDKDVKDDEADADVPSSPSASSTTASVAKRPVPTSVITAPVKLREPIPEDKQRELFKWILEEKRKLKPKDPKEKKQIDEEKAVLKQFIRGKSVPSF